jgi:uncharacterized membrane protein
VLLLGYLGVDVIRIKRVYRVVILGFLGVLVCCPIRANEYFRMLLLVSLGILGWCNQGYEKLE